MKPPVHSFLSAITLLALTVSTTTSCASVDPKTATPTVARVRLWPDRAPVGDGTRETISSELVVHLPAAELTTGAAVVVCPGGGYIRHVMDREGYPIADWLNSNG